jgi:hypothetical protein
MNWETIGATGEWAGALAVVVTLFYLARQIRHANLTSAAEAERDWIIAWVEAVANLGVDEHTAGIVQRGMSDYAALSRPEQGVFQGRVGALFDHAFLLVGLFDKGLMSQDVVDKVMLFCHAIARSRGGATWWRIHGPGYAIAEYFAASAARLEAQILPLEEYMPAWTADADFEASSHGAIASTSHRDP